MDLEVEGRENQKVIDLQENQIEKLREEVKTYQTLMQVRYFYFFIVNRFFKVLVRYVD